MGVHTLFDELLNCTHVIMPHELCELHIVAA